MMFYSLIKNYCFKIPFTINGYKTLLRIFIIACLLSITTPVYSTTLEFDQLNWFGISTNTADSTWGRVTIDYTGFSTRQYFNLNVDGRWVVQNMGIDSLFGTGVGQAVSTTFDLGVSDGTDVTNLNYVFSIAQTPFSSIPIGTFASDTVNDIDYQIGGEGGVDLGSPGKPDAPTGGNTATPEKSAKMPNIDKFVNQVQKKNECAPGAISNSLKYLQAKGVIDSSIDTDIDDIKPIINWDSDGAPQSWPTLKGKHFKDNLITKIIGATDIDRLIDEVNKGEDVELDLRGHVAVIAGVRKYSDGRVEMDIFDDNQKDSVADSMRTVEIRNGKIDNMSIDGYVSESPVPEPSTMLLLGFGLIGLAGFSRKKVKK